MNTQLLVGINGYVVKMMKMFGVPKVGEDSENTAKVSLFVLLYSFVCLVNTLTIPLRSTFTHIMASCIGRENQDKIPIGSQLLFYSWERGMCLLLTIFITCW